MHMLDAQDIVAIRKKLGLNQVEFAAALGVSFSAVYSWETGRRHPTWKKMARIHELMKSGPQLVLPGRAGSASR